MDSTCKLIYECSRAGRTRWRVISRCPNCGEVRAFFVDSIGVVHELDCAKPMPGINQFNPCDFFDLPSVARSKLRVALTASGCSAAS